MAKVSILQGFSNTILKTTIEITNNLTHFDQWVILRTFFTYKKCCTLNVASKVPHFVSSIKMKLFLRYFHSTDRNIVIINYFGYNHYAFISLGEEQNGGKGGKINEHHIN